MSEPQHAEAIETIKALISKNHSEIAKNNIQIQDYEYLTRKLVAENAGLDAAIKELESK
jgi:hypothetical protein